MDVIKYLCDASDIVAAASALLIMSKLRLSLMQAVIRSPAGALMIFFKIAQITIDAVTETHAQIARDAYRDFGKGSGHPGGPWSWPASSSSTRTAAARVCDCANVSGQNSPISRPVCCALTKSYCAPLLDSLTAKRQFRILARKSS
jgi:hypothetical protein